MIEIRTIQDFQNIKNNPDGVYILMNDIDAAETATWNPFGYINLGFEPIPEFGGVIYGQGYTISNLTINRPYDTEVSIFINFHGIIENLHFVNSHIEGKFYVAGLAVRAVGNLLVYKENSHGVLQNVQNGFRVYDSTIEVDLTAHAYAPDSTADGIIMGGMFSSINNIADTDLGEGCFIERCEIKPSFNLPGELTVWLDVSNGYPANLKNFIGGIVGRCHDWKVNAYITQDCKIDITIPGIGTDGDRIGRNCMIGGICGQAWTHVYSNVYYKFKNCLVQGTVTLFVSPGIPSVARTHAFFGPICGLPVDYFGYTEWYFPSVSNPIEAINCFSCPTIQPHTDFWYGIDVDHCVLTGESGAGVAFGQWLKKSRLVTLLDSNINTWFHNLDNLGNIAFKYAGVCDSLYNVLEDHYNLHGIWPHGENDHMNNNTKYLDPFVFWDFENVWQTNVNDTPSLRRKPARNFEGSNETTAQLIAT